MHLAVPKHDVLVTILIYSVQCLHSIGSIYKPNYLEKVYTNIVPIYILPIPNSIFTSNNKIIISVTNTCIKQKRILLVLSD